MSPNWVEKAGRTLIRGTTVIATLTLSLVLACVAPANQTAGGTATGAGPATDDLSAQALAEGQRVFRFDTFGDEQFWTDTAKMNEVVQITRFDVLP